MENKINIAELLKDCPKGMELDCTTWENVTFQEVRNDTIIIIRNNKQPYVDSVALNKYGRVTSYEDEKCRIFPKGKTTWEGFQRPFKDGDILTEPDGNNTFILHYDNGKFYDVHCAFMNDHLYIYKNKNNWVLNSREVRLATEEEKQKLFDAIKANGYHWNVETKTLDKLVESKEDDKAVIAGICFNREDYADEVELNLGDYEIKTRKDRTYAVLKNAETKTSQNLFPYGIGTKVWVKSDKERKYIHTIVGISRNSFGNLEYEVKEDKTGTVVHYPKDLLIPATTNELKFKTGDRIQHKNSRLNCTLGKYAEGISAYRTNIGLALTPKDLEQWELAPDKFDFNTLKPFDQVLVRCSNDGRWIPQFFAKFRTGSKFPFECTYNSWIQCVPYKGNEYLYDTTDNCSEFYRIWKDE